MTFAEHSRYLRKEKGLSQVELAKALNVSKACVSMIEIGKNEPTAITLIKYADFFECSIDYLLGRSDDFGNVTIVGQTERPLTREERAVVELFRKLPEDLKKRATAYLEKLSDLADEDGSVSLPVRKA